MLRLCFCLLCFASLEAGQICQFQADGTWPYDQGWKLVREGDGVSANLVKSATTDNRSLMLKDKTGEKASLYYQYDFSDAEQSRLLNDGWFIKSRFFVQHTNVPDNNHFLSQSTAQIEVFGKFSESPLRISFNLTQDENLPGSNFFSLGVNGVAVRHFNNGPADIMFEIEKAGDAVFEVNVYMNKIRVVSLPVTLMPGDAFQGIRWGSFGDVGKSTVFWENINVFSFSDD